MAIWSIDVRHAIIRVLCNCGVSVVLRNWSMTDWVSHYRWLSESHSGHTFLLLRTTTGSDSLHAAADCLLPWASNVFRNDLSKETAFVNGCTTFVLSRWADSSVDRANHILVGGYLPQDFVHLLNSLMIIESGRMSLMATVGRFRISCMIGRLVVLAVSVLKQTSGCRSIVLMHDRTLSIHAS